MMGWNVNDLTARANAPLAQFGPSGYVYAGDGSQHVVYEGFTPGGGSDGHVHELYWHSDGWHHHDLTQATGAPAIGAASYPTGYDFAQPDTIYGTQHVVYVATDGHVHELWYDADSGDGWQHHDLSAATNAPPAVNVVAGFGYNNLQRVFYEGTDVHIHLLTWNSDNGWHHTDLSAAAGAPPAAGSPRAYVFYEQGTEHALYLGGDGHIHELWSNPSGWHHNDLTVAAHAPLASDDPAGCALRSNSLQHVGYRGVDGHIHELLWLNGVWRHNDLHTMVVGAGPAAAGSLAVYGFDYQQTLHFVYTGTDGYIREFWFSGQDWHLNDLSIDTTAPLALSTPSGYVFDQQKSQHIMYTDTDHHIIELWWKA
jgi:hypothetical protein